MLRIMIQIVNEKKLKSSLYSKDGYQSDSGDEYSDYYENKKENQTSFSEDDAE